MKTACWNQVRRRGLARGRGFTLVELMIVVAIIGVLAALAVQGVRKYLASAKSAEARNMLGAINRLAVAAYEREANAPQLLAGGNSTIIGEHSLCGTAKPVPGNIANVSNKKYAPSTSPNADYQVGDMVTGWPCLRFVSAEPQYYQYAYTKGGKTITTALGYTGGAEGWSSEALGDLDGNGVLASFMLQGTISNGEAITATAVAFDNAEE